MDFWLQSEDLPRRENRIYYDGGKVVLDITEGDEQAAKRLKHKLESLMEPIGARPHLLERQPVSGQEHPDQRHRPPGRHLPLRHRPEDVRSRTWIAARMSSTTSTSPTPASFPPSAR